MLFSGYGFSMAGITSSRVCIAFESDIALFTYCAMVVRIVCQARSQLGKTGWKRAYMLD